MHRVSTKFCLYSCQCIASKFFDNNLKFSNYPPNVKHFVSFIFVGANLGTFKLIIYISTLQLINETFNLFEKNLSMCM